MSFPYEVTVEAGFSGAHQLRGYDGACAQLHGHNWRVLVTAGAERLDACGMAVDFGWLKGETRRILALVDHTFLNEVSPFTETNPTAENIARWVYDSLDAVMPTGSASLVRVAVWESHTAVATYQKIPSATALPADQHSPVPHLRPTGP